MSDLSDLCVMCGRSHVVSVVCDLDDGLGMAVTCADCLAMITNDVSNPQNVRDLAREALSSVRPV